MYLANQSTTQVSLPFGSYVVEQQNVAENVVSCSEEAQRTKFEVVDVPPKRNGDLLSTEQAVVARSLQRHYQLYSVGPTPSRLQTLLNEFMGRTK